MLIIISILRASFVQRCPDAGGGNGGLLIFSKLAKTLFEEILVEHNKVVAVKPRPELEPFFKLNFECHSRDIACDPDGIWIIF